MQLIVDFCDEFLLLMFWSLEGICLFLHKGTCVRDTGRQGITCIRYDLGLLVNIVNINFFLAAFFPLHRGGKKVYSQNLRTPVYDYVLSNTCKINTVISR